MAARNDVTGDKIQTREVSDAYRDNWDRIFGKKKDIPIQCTGTSQECSGTGCGSCVVSGDGDSDGGASGPEGQGESTE